MSIFMVSWDGIELGLCFDYFFLSMPHKTFIISLYLLFLELSFPI